MISPVQLTIGIPTYNRASQLAILLDKIAGESISRGLEILVSDNASLDSTLHVAESFRPRLGDRLTITGNDQNLGFDGNIFSLYRKARGKYIWFLSDDDDFVPGSIAKILAVIQREQDCGLIALPGANIEPYFAHGEAHAINLLPWRPTGKGAAVVLGQRQKLSGNEWERLALVIATSQVSHCIVRRAAPIASADGGGSILHSRIANLNLLHQPHYYILPQPTVIQSPWTGSSQWFMESTLFGIRELYSGPGMAFSGEAIDFVTVETCLFGISLLLAQFQGRSSVPIHFPRPGRGFANQLMRLYGAAYSHMAAAVEELLCACGEDDQLCPTPAVFKE